MDAESTSEKNKTVTFRIDKNVLDKIKSHATFERITLNALVNQLLAHAVDWDLVASKSGWVPVPKSLLISWFDKLDDKEIQSIAEEKGKIVSRDMLYTMKGKYSVWEWIAILRGRAKAAGFSFTQLEDKNDVKFIMRHDMGLKWSKHFKSFYESAFKELGCAVKFDLTENTIIYKLDKKYAQCED
ncbi:MAG TPA: hypothetical protein VJ771_05780 [Candidatus Nitrosotalea sp.]|nr:hypothetical protein [Candidatus Nitrosotalea sp.]